MKKKVFMLLPCIAAIVIATAIDKKTLSETSTNFSSLFSQDIEALSNCESIDGQKNNGHCTKNERLEYFCEKPGLLQTKNCLQ
ncbi:MAG: hypothetical protein IKA00_13760 [Prevotella sp.]|nr:hypothetical protein [Prevotella sp.]